VRAVSLSTHPLSRIDDAKALDVHDAVAPIERLPKWLLCMPIGVQLLWLGIKHRSMTLPSVLNPAIETGGLVGESKYSYLSRIASPFRHLVARTAVVRPGDDIDAVRVLNELTYPLIAKPDIGWCGYGVRRIESGGDLRAYAKAFPPDAEIMLQELVLAPHEAGLHYIRAPDAERGQVVALTLRHPPSVLGDGEHSIAELIAAKPRTKDKMRLYSAMLRPTALERVPRVGERTILTTVASTRIGGLYEDATHAITDALSATVDGLCRSMGGFEYGRLDVRFGGMEDLRQGRFKIIEINGAGSEAIQYWDPRLSIRRAFAGVFAKQRELYELAAEARGLGRKPIGVWALLRAHFKQQCLIRRYPPSN
jgi:hypothetical protein